MAHQDRGPRMLVVGIELFHRHPRRHGFRQERAQMIVKFLQPRSKGNAPAGFHPQHARLAQQRRAAGQRHQSIAGDAQTRINAKNEHRESLRQARANW